MTDEGEVTVPFDGIAKARLVLTDELIARGADASGRDRRG